MAYDAKLADRIRQVIGPRGDVTEKKMFGGIAFLLDGKMFCGIATKDLMVRVGPARAELPKWWPNEGGDRLERTAISHMRDVVSAS